MKISVIIPAYNEKGTIEEILRRVQAPASPTDHRGGRRLVNGTRQCRLAGWQWAGEVILHETTRGGGSHRIKPPGESC
jgi:hypothetical protein